MQCQGAPEAAVWAAPTQRRGSGAQPQSEAEQANGGVGAVAGDEQGRHEHSCELAEAAEAEAEAVQGRCDGAQLQSGAQHSQEGAAGACGAQGRRWGAQEMEDGEREETEDDAEEHTEVAQGEGGARANGDKLTASHLARILRSYGSKGKPKVDAAIKKLRKALASQPDVEFLFMVRDTSSTRRADEPRPVAVATPQLHGLVDNGKFAQMFESENEQGAVTQKHWMKSAHAKAVAELTLHVRALVRVQAFVDG